MIPAKNYDAQNGHDLLYIAGEGSMSIESTAHLTLQLTWWKPSFRLTVLGCRV